MPKILFLLSATKDVSAFSQVITELKRYPQLHCVVISLVKLRIVREDLNSFERVVKEDDLSYEEIGSYRTKNVIRILEMIAPDLIVMSSDESFIENSFVIATKSLGIPSILLQNGTFGVGTGIKYPITKALSRLILAKRVLSNYVFFFSTSLGSTRNPLKIVSGSLSYVFTLRLRRKGTKCDYCAVTGDIDREILIAENVKSSQICVTGNPAFDALTDTSQSRLDLLQKLSLDPSKKVAVFLTTSAVEHQIWTERQRDFFADTVISALSSIQDMQVAVKIHPLEKMQTYSRFKNRDVLLFNSHLNDLIRVSDVILNYYSTAALPAMMLYKPLIELNLFGEKKSVPYVSMGAAIEACNGKEIVERVQQVLHDERTRHQLLLCQRNFLCKYANNSDGLARVRVAEFLIRVLAVNSCETAQILNLCGRQMVIKGVPK